VRRDGDADAGRRAAGGRALRVRLPLIAVVVASAGACGLQPAATQAPAARAAPRPGDASPGVGDSCAAYPPQQTSPYVLPWRAGESHIVWRTRAHYTRGNGGVGLYAIDFEMPIGTPIVAARSGVVVAVRDTFPDGNNEDLKENFVFVRHADGTVARYFHLTRGGARVALGDSVRQGEVIALSGNSGQTTGPHLHFDVQTCGPNLPPNYNRLPCGQTVPVTFRNTRSHPCGLVPGEWYAAGPVDRGDGGDGGRARGASP
jgi:murein DD-endopeptidase MepM/ murein hydrolase activator NlpD